MEGERWVGGGLPCPLYTVGRGKGEGERCVGGGLTCPLYTEGGVRGRERGGQEGG